MKKTFLLSLSLILILTSVYIFPQTPVNKTEEKRIETIPVILSVELEKKADISRKLLEFAFNQTCGGHAGGHECVH